MMPLLARVTKRLAILLLGSIIIYLTVWKVFPFFDNRTPVTIALLATYAVMAYVVIPLLFRVYRFFYHPVHLPLYCTTPDGFASDPINIALIGTRRQVVHAMETAGWKLADEHSAFSVLRQIFSTVSGHSYPNAPMSRLYLFGRRQDFGFEIEISGSRGKRHHVRFWATDAQLNKELEHHARFWRRFYRPIQHGPNVQFWVGAASKDTGFAPIRHNAQLTHMIDPDTNSERKLIVRDLRRARMLKGSRTVQVNRPFSLKNRAWRGYLQSDGKIAVCELR
jgi:hypothetical protein